jgi:REP element-mobilizing transposase RayT
LPEIVRQLKTFSSRKINIQRGTAGVAVWQRNYYEHIIRSDADLERVQAYIHVNPLRWELDREHPERIDL